MTKELHQHSLIISSTDEDLRKVLATAAKSAEKSIKEADKAHRARLKRIRFVLESAHA